MSKRCRGSEKIRGKQIRRSNRSSTMTSRRAGASLVTGRSDEIFHRDIKRIKLNHETNWQSMKSLSGKVTVRSGPRIDMVVRPDSASKSSIAVCDSFAYGES